MPKFSTKTLSFPMGGVSRSLGYWEQTRPYTSPWAVNVRGVSALEERRRGGSRPGTAKANATHFAAPITAVASLASVSTAGTRRQDVIVVADGNFSCIRGDTVIVPNSVLLDGVGDPVLDGSGDEIMTPSTTNGSPYATSPVFCTAELHGRLYFADSVLRVYDPETNRVDDVVATLGAIPTGCPIVAAYRDRIVLGGADHIWYASRQAEPTDWNYGADMNDTGAAVAGALKQAGILGENITAMVPYRDSILTLATRNGLWALHGDPADGKAVELSSEIGIVSPHAWAMAPDGLMAFLSSDGVYLATPGERPARFSAERVPNELQNTNVATTIVTMAYDANGRGFHLFLTPKAVDGVTAQATHWWIDVENKAMWPVILPSGMQPVAVTRIPGTNGLSEPVFGCVDGYLRKFSASAADDDGNDIESHVVIGPFRITSDDISDAMLTELHGIMADNSDGITCRVVMGDSAEECADKAVAGIAADLAGGTILGVAFTCDFNELRNAVFRPRARGVWATIWLAADAAWAYEAVAVKIAHLGRIR